MTHLTQRLTRFYNRFSPGLENPWLDVVALFVWGILLLKYWITGKLYILIHPNYFSLSIIAGITLLVLGGLKARQIIQESSVGSSPSVQHITLFPRGMGSLLLIITACLGLLITPQMFGAQTALKRGLTESLPITRAQPQKFRTAIQPENRSLIEWVRLLNVNPEPDAYTGQKAKITGFVIHPPDLPKNYIWLGRFILTCCAADAYPVGIPVLLPEGKSRELYPQDSWLDIEGIMFTETFNNERKLTLKAQTVKAILPPKNPYDY
ncbi:MAG: TIGR03943 family protein [Planktothrix agardhii KL2]|uniref:TIGR03943 family putative permease subunit n=1 Tax=Planktothrix agardhii TaxID=1160 RepID=UPI001A1B0F25|nr:TIGR03943 family protein [Planktothrix agardhii]MBG0747843.1 TIGR03943 family protein [Planktothrix agardhii KL2]